MHHVHWPSDLCDCVSTTLHTFPYSPLGFWNSRFCLQDFPLLVPAPFLSPAPLHGKVLSVPMISHDTCERVVACFRYRWYHITRVKVLWRVVSTDDITPHVWKSCDVLLVLMISHDTSERVVTCCRYIWYHITRVKKMWRVVSTDITSHVWKCCDVLLVLMISHHTSERVVTCYQ